jgi:tetratricopeptide (TPR) repeat protein
LLGGRPQAALPHLEFAARSEPERALYHCNLGEARRRAGDAAGAVEALERALRLQPDYPLARYNLGCALLARGSAKDALREFRALVRADPLDARYRCARGDALREMGRFRRAAASYRRALKLEPKLPAAHSNLGALLLQRGRAEKGLEHCRRAVELAESDYRTHLNLGRCLVETEALDEAMTAYARAHELAPESVELNCSIGDVWRGVGEVNEANFWYSKALALDPASPQARAGVALLKLEVGDTEGAVADLRELAAAQPDDYRLLLELSQAHWDDGDTEEAIATLRRAVALQPESAMLHARIGGVLASAGKVEEAGKAYETALRLNPNCVPALSGLAMARRAQLDPALVERLAHLVTVTRLRDGAKSMLHGGLATWHDARGETERAILHGRQANECQWRFKTRRGWEYEPAEHERQVSALIHGFTTEFLTRTADLGSDDPTPVFVVGMPRSGTTLTEQILASHPQVVGIGERNLANASLHRLQQHTGETDPAAAIARATPQQVQALARRYLAELGHLKRKVGKPDARFVVDKMPDNYLHVGWILTLFPKATVIYARRDLRDVALSCWLTQFGQIRWACDMGHIASRIREHLRLMAHWQRVLGDRLQVSDYESLVADQEPQTRRLLGMLGLPWDPACLEFHKTERIVRTASVSQVRNPMYRSSVARWKPYQSELAPVIEVLEQAARLTPIGEDVARA